MYSVCRRLLFQVRLNKPTVCLTKLPRDGFLVILLIFPIHFCFISIFAVFAIQTKFIFSCDGITLLNHDGFGRNWIYCASRFRKIAARIKIYFLPEKRFHASFPSQLSRFLKVLENWIRQYFITYNLQTWFILTKSKQNWKKKSLLFLPASACRRDRVWFAFIWWHFPGRRVSGKTPRADHTSQNSPHLS